MKVANQQANNLLQNNELPLVLYIQIKEKYDKPCIELRRIISDYALIKILVSCAYNKQPIVIMPEFSNTLRSLSSLVDKGILFRTKDGKFHFTF